MDHRPPDIHEQILVVRVRASEPPPDWPSKVIAKVRDEMNLLYGKNATVDAGAFKVIHQMLPPEVVATNGHTEGFDVT